MFRLEPDVDEAKVTVYMPQEQKPSHLLALFIIAMVLYLMYSSPLHSVYYFADEMNRLFTESSWAQLKRILLRSSWVVGRPISRVSFGLMGNLVNQVEDGLEILRWLQYVLSVGTAFLLYYLVRLGRADGWWATCVVLLIWAQPVFQVCHVYSVTAPFLLGVCFSYLAFFIIQRHRSGEGGWWVCRLALATLFLSLSWLSYQASPFAALAPLCFHVLTTPEEDWRRERRKYYAFLLALAISMVLFIALFKTAHLLLGINLYAPGKRIVSLLDSGSGWQDYLSMLHPRNYLISFEFWNYLLPVRNLGNVRNMLAYGAMVAWACVFLASSLLDAKTQGFRTAGEKVLLVLVSVGCSFLPLIAAQDGARQHLQVAFVPTLLLVFAYGLTRIVTGVFRAQATRRVAFGVLVGAIAVIIAGAYGNVHRGLVLPSMRFVDFVGGEIARAGDQPLDRVLVVNARAPRCWHEPCSGFFARRGSICGRDSVGVEGFYRGMLRQAGRPHEVPVLFTWKSPSEDQLEGALVIDLRRYVAYVNRQAVLGRY